MTGGLLDLEVMAGRAGWIHVWLPGLVQGPAQEGFPDVRNGLMCGPIGMPIARDAGVGADVDHDHAGIAAIQLRFLGSTDFPV